MIHSDLEIERSWRKVEANCARELMPEILDISKMLGFGNGELEQWWFESLLNGESHYRATEKARWN